MPQLRRDRERTNSITVTPLMQEEETLQFTATMDDHILGREPCSHVVEVNALSSPYTPENPVNDEAKKESPSPSCHSAAQSEASSYISLFDSGTPQHASDAQSKTNDRTRANVYFPHKGITKVNSVPICSNGTIYNKNDEPRDYVVHPTSSKNSSDSTTLSLCVFTGQEIASIDEQRTTQTEPSSNTDRRRCYRRSQDTDSYGATNEGFLLDPHDASEPVAGSHLVDALNISGYPHTIYHGKTCRQLCKDFHSRQAFLPNDTKQFLSQARASGTTSRASQTRGSVEGRSLAKRRSSSVGDGLSLLVSMSPSPAHSRQCHRLPRTSSEPIIICLDVERPPRKKYPMVRTPSWASTMTNRTVSVDEQVCRICWQGESREAVIQPCYCEADVHESCMRKWMEVSDATGCEVCTYEFKTRTKFKPLTQWQWLPNKDRHLAQLEATILLLAIVTPPLLCGIILCCQKIGDYLFRPEVAWEMAGLLVLVMVSLIAYIAAAVYFLQKVCKVGSQWIERNRMKVVYITNLSRAERRPWDPTIHGGGALDTDIYTIS